MVVGLCRTMRCWIVFDERMRQSLRDRLRTQVWGDAAVSTRKMRLLTHYSPSEVSSESPRTPSPSPDTVARPANRPPPEQTTDVITARKSHAFFGVPKECRARISYPENFRAPLNEAAPAEHPLPLAGQNLGAEIMAEMAARRDASNVGQASMTTIKPSSNEPVVAGVVAPSAESRIIGSAGTAGSVSSHVAKMAIEYFQAINAYLVERKSPHASSRQAAPSEARLSAGRSARRGASGTGTGLDDGQLRGGRSTERTMKTLAGPAERK